MDSIGGKSMTLLVVTISPSIFDIEATKSSLQFAEQTGRVTNHVGRLNLINKVAETI